MSVLTTLAKVLERNNFVVDKAESGREAIEKSRSHTYDAALIDLKLPDMDGVEVLTKAQLPDTVKIMLTGHPSIVSSLLAEEQGIDAYLAKPVKPEELLLLIESKLKSHEKTPNSQRSHS